MYEEMVCGLSFTLYSDFISLDPAVLYIVSVVF